MKFYTYPTQCLACKKKLEVHAKYPGFLEKVPVFLTCKFCDSELRYIISRALMRDNQPKGSFKIERMILKANPYIVQMMKEEEDWNSQPLQV